MSGFVWSEIAPIGAVAPMPIGPMRLPVAIPLVADGVWKMRRLAVKMQDHVDEIVREADLGAVRDAFCEPRAMNLESQFLPTIACDILRPV